jgi:hypothetical protein
VTKRTGVAGSQLIKELFVVTLGVMIALAADSWWADRSDSERRSAYLIALEADMNAADSVLGAGLDSVEQSLRESRAVLQYFDSPAFDPAVEDHGIPIGLPTVPIPVGTLRSLVSTSDITLLEDVSLRNTLVRESATIESGLLGVRRALAVSDAQVPVLGAVIQERLVRSDGTSNVALWEVRDDIPIRAATWMLVRNLEMYRGELTTMRESVRAVLSALRESGSR